MKDVEFKALLEAYKIPHKQWNDQKFKELQRIVSRGESRLDTINGRLGVITPCVGIRILYQVSPSNWLILKPIDAVPHSKRIILSQLDITLCKERLPSEKDFDVIADLMRNDLNIIATSNQFKRLEKGRQEKESLGYLGMVEIFDTQIYEGELSKDLYNNLKQSQELRFKWEMYDKAVKAK